MVKPAVLFFGLMLAFCVAGALPLAAAFADEGAGDSGQSAQGSNPPETLTINTVDREVTLAPGGDSTSDTGTIYVQITELYDEAYQVLDLVNKERKKEGLPALTMDKDLLEAAMQRATECLLYFEHTRPSGKLCSTVDEKVVGENIAYGTVTASGTMGLWMNSPMHKSNILASSYKSIGIGCVKQEGGIRWVQLFGYEKANPASVKKGSKNKTRAIDISSKEANFVITLHPVFHPDKKVSKGDSDSLLVTCSHDDGHGGYVFVEPESFGWRMTGPFASSAVGSVDFVTIGKVTVEAAILGSKFGGSVTYTVSPAWHRIWGESQYDTMRQVVKLGWKKKGGTVIVASGENYQDALSAAGVAGLSQAPIIITKGASLSSQAKAELKRLKPSKVIVVGGRYAITPATFNAIKTAAGTTNVKRFWGEKASDTAANLNKAHKSQWKSGTAVLASAGNFQDALSIAPIAYSKGYPVFLSDSTHKVTGATIKAMKACGIKDVIVVGGIYAIGNDVVDKLAKNGIKLKKRLWGNTAYDTSRAIANWGLKNGMNADGMGVAQGRHYSDALCGAAFCGLVGSVIVLADGSNYQNASVAKSNKAKIEDGVVYGGVYAVEPVVYDAFYNATKVA